MVKSETLFCRLVAIDTLLSFDGVIPSAPDFQLRLVSLMEQFNKALLAENELQEDSEALCRALCGYFDQRLCSEKNSALSWQRYSLMHYFYGFTESEENLPLPVQLDSLLNLDSEVIFRYAWKLLTLLMQVEGETDTLVALRVAKRARYFSQARPVENRLESPAAIWPDCSTATADIPRLMVFVIGPFAGKWFNQSDLSSNGSDGVIWVIVEHANTLANRLEYLKKNYGTMATLAFFPLLADGFENSGIMIEQITAWQYACCSTRLPGHLPCMLGLYTRLSQQRYPHDPDRAIWSGGLTEPPHGHLKLETRLVNLLTELDVNHDGKDLYTIQRHALGNTLISWLAESRVMNTLQTLFDTTQLDLAGVTLADHGQGFTRYGAWSLWLSEKYSILPGLSASIAVPPLPSITLPPIEEPVPTQPPASPPAANPPLRHRRWPKVIALLALLLCVGIGYTLWQDITRSGSQLARFTPLKALFKQSEKTEDPAFLALLDNTPFFENGSSNLMPDSQKVLAQLVPDIVRNPHRTYLIVGHSDNTGSAAVNMALSTERAQVIRSWLIEHSGLAPDQFIVEGAGNSRPIASNATQEGRAQNRRVEIIPLPLQSNKD